MSTLSPIDFVLSKLSNVKKTSKGWKATCPCHEDKKQSLFLKVGQKEQALLRCHAGCPNEEIVSTIGLQMKDLFVQKHPRSRKTLFEIVEIYDYVDKNGQLLYQVCRTPDKQFPLRHKGPDGKWIWNLGNQKRVLYRLPELIQAIREEKIIFIVEGEKDVNRLYQEGLYATTSPLGAHKWREEYNSYFKDGMIFILPDNDKAGKKHAQHILEQLSGTAACAEIVELPHLQKGEDVSDWLDKYGTKEDLLQFLPSLEIKENNSIWQDELEFTTNSKGQTKLVSCLHNAITILGHAPEWEGVLAYDEFQSCVVLLSQPPWHPHDASPEKFQRGQIWSDEDDTRLSSWLSRHWKIRLTTTQIGQVIRVCAHQNLYHPVREYLTGLSWDQKPRLQNWLIEYLGAEDSEYVQKVGEWWMISAVARIFQPGCKVDHVLILEGEQGIRKSATLEVLANGWFTDTPFDIGSKDGYLALRGQWIVELAELDSLGRAESARAKAFFSSPCDLYRTPYAREAKKYPRQCVFAGTVNDSSYLKDSTGGRRYWPVVCNEIDLEGLNEIKEQLWAEAVWLYQEGASWWPENSFENELCAVQQADRYQHDAWEPILSNWLENRPDPYAPVNITELLSEALHIEPSHWNKALQIRIGKCMNSLGWKKTRLWNENRTQRIAIYSPPKKKFITQSPEKEVKAPDAKKSSPPQSKNGSKTKQSGLRQLEKIEETYNKNITSSMSISLKK